MLSIHSSHLSTSFTSSTLFPNTQLVRAVCDTSDWAAAEQEMDAVHEELARLQDKIKPFPTVEARAIIEADLGAPVDEIFSEFTAEPIAAASLAQV
jgi:hypothetical protein